MKGKENSKAKQVTKRIKVFWQGKSIGIKRLLEGGLRGGFVESTITWPVGPLVGNN